jgi:hypothetical protein
VILPADKGNATVVLSSTDYHNKIKVVLDDPVYRRLTTDPTNSFERQTAALTRKSDIPTFQQKLPTGSYPVLRFLPDHTLFPRSTRSTYH